MQKKRGFNKKSGQNEPNRLYLAELQTNVPFLYKKKEYINPNRAQTLATSGSVNSTLPKKKAKKANKTLAASGSVNFTLNKDKDLDINNRYFNESKKLDLKATNEKLNLNKTSFSEKKLKFQDKDLEEHAVEIYKNELTSEKLIFNWEIMHLLFYFIGDLMKSDKKFLFSNEHNFNKESFLDQRYFIVAEHNDLITKARHDLNARELKIMDFVVSKIKPDDDHFNIIDTSLYEIATVLNLKINGRTYSQISMNLDDMRAKRLHIYNPTEKSVTMTGWFERAKVVEDGKVELKINEDFAPYLLKLKNTGNYTQYMLYDTVQLKSKYSILLYKLMREADKFNSKKDIKDTPILQGSPEDFMHWLGAPKGYNYGRLKDKILKPAINEINLKIMDMSLSLYQAKRGRSVVQVEIHNEISYSSDSMMEKKLHFLEKNN